MRVAWHVHGTLEHVHGMCIEAHCMFLSQGGGDAAPAHRRSSQLCQRAQLAQLRGRPAGRARHVHQRQECQNQKVTVARPPARVPQWPIECRGAARGTAMHSLLTHNTHTSGSWPRARRFRVYMSNSTASRLITLIIKRNAPTPEIRYIMRRYFNTRKSKIIKMQIAKSL